VLDLKFAAFRAKRRANFKSKTHTGKHTLASVLIDSEVRQSHPQALANFGSGTPAAVTLPMPLGRLIPLLLAGLLTALGIW
jgi:hypothetical protein